MDEDNGHCIHDFQFSDCHLLIFLVCVCTLWGRGFTLSFWSSILIFVLRGTFALLDWTKSRAAVNSRLRAIRHKLRMLTPARWPKQNINARRWGIFLMDTEGCNASVYMMKHGAHIPLEAYPYFHDPGTFPKLEK